jgi:hypothetical protein
MPPAPDSTPSFSTVIARRPFDGIGMTGLEGQFAIHQAIGVLIERGYTPETALDELRRLAQLDCGELQHAAEQVLATIAEPRRHDLD